MHRTYRNLVHDEISENTFAPSSEYRAAVAFQGRYVLVVAVPVAIDAAGQFVLPSSGPSIRLLEIARVGPWSPELGAYDVTFARIVEVDQGELVGSHGLIEVLLGEPAVLGPGVRGFDEAWRSVAGLRLR